MRVAIAPGYRVERRRPRIFPFPRPQPRKASGLREGLHAGRLIGVRNVFQLAHHTWDRARRTIVYTAGDRDIRIVAWVTAMIGAQPRFFTLSSSHLSKVLAIATDAFTLNLTELSA
jgi:hypothetical protein